MSCISSIVGYRWALMTYREPCMEVQPMKLLHSAKVARCLKYILIRFTCLIVRHSHLVPAIIPNNLWSLPWLEGSRGHPGCLIRGCLVTWTTERGSSHSPRHFLPWHCCDCIANQWPSYGSIDAPSTLCTETSSPHITTHEC